MVELKSRCPNGVALPMFSGVEEGAKAVGALQLTFETAVTVAPFPPADVMVPTVTVSRAPVSIAPSSATRPLVPLLPRCDAVARSP